MEVVQLPLFLEAKLALETGHVPAEIWSMVLDSRAENAELLAHKHPLLPLIHHMAQVHMAQVHMAQVHMAQVHMDPPLTLPCQDLAVLQ
jgi:hypothetical protein